MANLSNRNFRISEIEQKSDFTNVIRASNYDSKYYLNDKDTPTEDIELMGGNPPVEESSWSSRFFFLPTRLCSSLASVVGKRTRWNQFGSFENGRSPGGSYGGNLWSQTDSARDMECYAVTTDPALVPLTVTAMESLGTGNIDNSWPSQPSYRYWNGAELRIAAYHSSTMGTPWPGTPDTVYDERGPFETFHYYHPWAFSVYETRNITSINGQQFVCAGRQSYEGISPTWLRTSLGANHSRYNAYSTTGWGPFENCKFYSSGLTPFCVYVLRPSTGQIVGWLAWDVFGTNKTAINGPSNPATLPTSIVEAEVNQWYYAWGGYANVTGMQTGDLIVWEWWSFSTGTVWFMSDSTTVNRGGPATCHIRTHWGGGQAGQPLTKNGQTGLPNWAPAHRSDLSAMTGYRPR